MRATIGAAVGEHGPQPESGEGQEPRDAEVVTAKTPKQAAGAPLANSGASASTSSSPKPHSCKIRPAPRPIASLEDLNNRPTTAEPVISRALKCGLKRRIQRNHGQSGFRCERYFRITARHIRFVDDLLDRLADQALGLGPGDRILVLGSGDGTHDPGFAKHGSDITDLEIQPEVARLGRAKATTLPASINYVIGDMTAPLTDLIPDRSMAAVFNIGSSFGYEDQDEVNAGVFRHAARVLREGAPFVFEYVNGPHWVDKRVQRQIDVTDLPNGSTRTEVSITNPQAGTSLTLIGLRRRDGSGGWFSHFMHYYQLDEVTAMMAQAGLLPVAVLGATGGRVKGEPFDETASEAMVIIATAGGRA